MTDLVEPNFKPDDRAQGSQKQRRNLFLRSYELSKEIVRRRSLGWCECPPCDMRADQFHHRRRRSQGGDNSPGNLLHVCTPCHDDRIHGDVANAVVNGWLIHTEADQ